MKTKEEIKKYNREFMRKNKKKYEKKFNEWKEAHPNYFKDWAKKNKDKISAASIRYLQKNRDKLRKIRAVNKSTRIRFKREKNCGICGDTQNLNFHHWIYKKPVERKDFSTLCSYCHKVQHGGIKNNGIV